MELSGKNVKQNVVSYWIIKQHIPNYNFLCLSVIILQIQNKFCNTYNCYAAFYGALLVTNTFKYRGICYLSSPFYSKIIIFCRFETADINEPTPEGDGDNDVPPLLLILGYGSGVQVWLIPPNGEAQEVLSWRQGTVRVLRILPTPQHGDCFASKRSLIALCDSASPGPAFCSLSFISIRGGEQASIYIIYNLL